MTTRQFLLFILVISSHVSLGQQKQKVKYDYLLYLPKDYAKKSKKYPLLIYLHGGSQKGNDLNKLKTYGLPYLINKGKHFDFIVVSPQCPNDKFWSTDNWFELLFEEISHQYNIDTNRVYCTGISMGGYGSYIVTMDFPDKFAAILPLCGGINDEDTTRVCNLSQIPIWTFHGTADDKIQISETERIVKSLKKCHGNIKFSRLKNEGHSIEYLYETKPQLYRWLLKQKKK